MESFRVVIDVDRQAHPSAEPTSPSSGENTLAAILGHFPTIDEVENHLIDEAMKMAQGNQGIAAKLLGLGRQTLNKRLMTRR